MSKTYVFSTCILLLAAGLITWWSLQIVKEATQQDHAEPHHPDAIAMNFTYKQMDNNGLLHHIFHASKLIHYPYQNSSVFEKPDIKIINSKQPPWHITARRGNSKYGTKVVQLLDNVKLHQKAGLNNKELIIMTSAATIYLLKKYVTTDKPVTILQPGTVATAIGANADLGKKVINLLSDVRETYVPHK